MADFSFWCLMTNVPDCCGLIEFNFMVNNSCVTLGSALLILRLWIVDVMLFKFFTAIHCAIIGFWSKLFGCFDCNFYNIGRLEIIMLSLPEESFMSSVCLTAWSRYLAKDEDKHHREPLYLILLSEIIGEGKLIWSDFNLQYVSIPSSINSIHWNRFHLFRVNMRHLIILLLDM